MIGPCWGQMFCLVRVLEYCTAKIVKSPNPNDNNGI